MQSTQVSGPRPGAEWKGVGIGPETHRKLPEHRRDQQLREGTGRKEQDAPRGPEASFQCLAARARSRLSLLSFRAEENVDRGQGPHRPSKEPSARGWSQEEERAGSRNEK